MHPPVPAAFHHTAFVVRDLEATAQRLADSLRIGPWQIWTVRPEVCRVRGVDSPFSFRVALATVGGATFELVSPHSGRSVLDEHLERHGDGFHHTCLSYSSLAEAQAAKTALLAQGREVVQEARAGERLEFAYFSYPELGSIVEVLYRDSSQLTPPEAVIAPR